MNAPGSSPFTEGSTFSVPSHGAPVGLSHSCPQEDPNSTAHVGRPSSQSHPALTLTPAPGASLSSGLWLCFRPDGLRQKLVIVVVRLGSAVDYVSEVRTSQRVKRPQKALDFRLHCLGSQDGRA